MVIGRTKDFGRIVAFILAAAIISAAGAPALRGEEDDGEKGLCREALEKCFLSYLAGALASWGLSAFASLVFCLNGYAFCERYVAPYLRGECL